MKIRRRKLCVDRIVYALIGEVELSELEAVLFGASGLLMSPATHPKDDVSGRVLTTFAHA